MKHTPQIRTWAAWLGFTAVLAAIPLSNTQAAFTDSGSATGSGSNVIANAGSSGTVTGTSYSTTVNNGHGWYASAASKITGSNAVIHTAGNSAYGVYATGSSLANIASSTITTSGSAGFGIFVSGQSRINADGVNITTTGPVARAVTLTGSSTGHLNNMNINTTGSSSTGIYVLGSSTLFMLQGGTISTGSSDPTAAAGVGINLTGTSVAHLKDVTILGTGVSAAGFYMTESSTVSLENVYIRTSGSMSFYAGGTSSVTIVGGTIRQAGDVTNHSTAVVLNQSTTGNLTDVFIESNFAALQVVNSSTLNMNGGHLISHGNQGAGVFFLAQSTGTLNGVQIETTGSDGTGISSSGTSSVVGNNLTVNTSGNGAAAAGVSSGGQLTFNGGSFATSGTQAAGMYIGGSAGSSLTVNNVDISTTGPNSDGISMGASGTQSGTQTLIVNGGSIDAQNGSGISINNYRDPLNSRYLDTESSGSNTVYEIQINSGAQLSGTEALTIGSIVTGTDSSGNLSDLDVHTVATITVDGSSSLSGGVIIKDNANVALNLNNNSSLTGDIIGSGSSNTVVNLDHSSLSGDVTNSGSGAMVINGSNGSVITGDIANTSSGTTWALFNEGVSFQGNGNNNGAGDLIMNLKSDYSGTITNSGSGGTVFTIDGATMTGDILNTASGTTWGNFDNGANLIGNGILEGDGALILNLGGGDLTGNITNNGGGAIQVTVDGGNMTGDFINSPTSTGTSWGYFDNGASLTGDANNQGSGDIILNLNNGSTMTGDLDNTGAGKVTADLANDSHGIGYINGGDLSLHDTSSWTIPGNDKPVVIGEITFDGGSLKDNYPNTDGKWTDITIDTVSGSNGTIYVNMNSDTPEGDHLKITDHTGTNNQIIWTDHGSGKNLPDEFQLPTDIYDGPDSFNQEVNNGMGQWTSNPGDDNWFHYNGLNQLGQDIVNATGAQSLGMLAGLDSMGNHLNSLRSGGKDGIGRDVNIWVQSYGQQYNIGGQYGGKSFSNLVYGVDIGADKAWELDKHNLLVGGVFAGYGSTDADFRRNGSEAHSDSYGGGLYGMWLEESGWFADATFKGAWVDGDFDSYTARGNKTSGQYDNLAMSIAANIGKRFTFKDDWYAEPSVGAAYVYLGDYHYSTSGNTVTDVNITEANVYRFKAGSAFGRTINLGGKGFLQPYVKVFGIEQCSDGGKVQSGGREWRPTLDGPAAQLGVGIVWQIDEVNQLHLDYDAEFGQNYDKPFGITAGFRHQF